jgi:alpha-beta hydrolase superfamily lysophospholipase
MVTVGGNVSRTPTTRAAQVELHRIATNGIHANAAIAGAGPAVVLLHGFPHTWQLWSHIIGPLSEHYRVIAPDLRGFGASTRAPDGYDAGTLATDIDGILGSGKRTQQCLHENQPSYPIGSP